MKIAIVGAGRFGISLTDALIAGNHEITIIDKDEDVCEKASGMYDALVVCDNAKRVSFLKDLHIDKYDVFVACTEDDEKNIVLCSFAKSLGCKMVIARVRDPEHTEQFDFLSETLHIDHIVNPDMACAAEIHKFLTEKYALDGGRLVTGNVAIIEFPIEKRKDLIDKSIREIASNISGMLIGAVSRGGKIMIPTGSTILQAGDILYVIGDKQAVNSLGGRLRGGSAKKDLSKLMIAGGGNTGYFLAKKMEESGVNIKIIEKQRSRCEYLSDRLSDALILHGDATDTKLLSEEGFDDMDAFVAVTGFDEENLLLSLMATKHKIEDVVAKVSSRNYNPLTENLGVSMTINPMDMCNASILRFIQKDNSIIFSQIIQGQAEFIEVVAESGMPLCEKPIAQTHIPQGILIAAINRNGQTIIPNGASKVEAGDKVVILSLLASIAELDALLNKGRAHTL